MTIGDGGGTLSGTEGNTPAQNKRKKTAMHQGAADREET